MYVFCMTEANYPANNEYQLNLFSVGINWRNEYHNVSELTMSDKHYWFPAMRYGFGWGLPITWQGWLSMLVVIALAAFGGLTIPERYGTLVFVCYDIVLVSLFLGLCWWKGEFIK